jgi:hypothetical protein
MNDFIIGKEKKQRKEARNALDTSCEFSVAIAFHFCSETQS